MEFEAKRYYRQETSPAAVEQAAGDRKPHLARFLAEKEADPDIERLLEGRGLSDRQSRPEIEDEFSG
ncbi:hypothetical protein KCP76_20250 [Salmonella enterica subsp. enterica serovar Weltevreden]|nr:hypothetical protein KCP76_20250 [Salmonella enterica subsp. enterica serovar Weltevreden]